MRRLAISFGQAAPAHVGSRQISRRSSQRRGAFLAVLLGRADVVATGRIAFLTHCRAFI